MRLYTCAPVVERMGRRVASLLAGQQLPDCQPAAVCLSVGSCIYCKHAEMLLRFAHQSLFAAVLPLRSSAKPCASWRLFEAETLPGPALQMCSYMCMTKIPLPPVYAGGPVPSISTQSALPGRHRRKLLDEQVLCSILC